MGNEDVGQFQLFLEPHQQIENLGLEDVYKRQMLYLVRSGRYLSYVTPKLAPYLCFSAAVMVVWALSSLGRMFRIQYRKHIAHCFVLAIPLLLLLLPHDTVGLRDISDSAGLLLSLIHI